MHSDSGRVTGVVLGIPIDALDWIGVLARMRGWTSARESRYVCICNVHVIVTGGQDPQFAAILSQADMATPDGAPVAWVLRRLGFGSQPRISGPDLMWRYCAEAASRGEPIYLYGSTSSTLQLLVQRLVAAHPGLKIAGASAPPFRELTAEEDAAVVEQINGSGARTVWVGLGCPKQEKWMAAHRGRVRAVMIGVGAAFDYHAGTVARAPRWMQQCALEWLFRLCSEPRRLWKRYLFTNAIFLVRLARYALSRR